MSEINLVKMLKLSNKGNELIFSTVYDKFCILHRKTCVETPQQNSVVKHQHIFNITCNLLFQSDLSKVYWSYVAAHVVYFMNRLCYQL